MTNPLRPATDHMKAKTFNDLCDAILAFNTPDEEQRLPTNSTRVNHICFLIEHARSTADSLLKDHSLTAYIKVCAIDDAHAARFGLSVLCVTDDVDVHKHVTGSWAYAMQLAKAEATNDWRSANNMLRPYAFAHAIGDINLIRWLDRPSTLAMSSDIAYLKLKKKLVAAAQPA